MKPEKCLTVMKASSPTDPYSAVTIRVTPFSAHKYSDITLVLGPNKHEVSAHKLVLGARSPYFDKLFTGEWKENKSNTVELTEYSPHAVWRAIEFIYRDDYSVEAQPDLSDDGDDMELLKHPRVYALADMFEISSLQKFAARKFQTQLHQHWISDTFPDCVREVYSTTNEKDDTLKEIVVGVAKAHLSELTKRLAFNNVVRDVDEFALDLVQSLAGTRQWNLPD